MKRQSYLLITVEGTKHQTNKLGKQFSRGSVYTHANKGRPYWMQREEWPEASQPVPRRLPAYMIPLHLRKGAINLSHRTTMAGFTRGKGFRTA
jgi:hypothetical protein